MTPTRRTLRTTAASALLAAAVLAGCTDDEPPQPSPTPSPTSDAAPTTAPDDVAATTPPEEVAVTTGPDEVAVTSDGPDDGAVTTAPDEAAVTTAPEAEVVEASDGTFEVTIPQGWEQALDLARRNVDEDQRDAVVLAAKDRERRDEFFTNVVVTREEYVNSLTSAVEDTARELAGEDGEYELLDPVAVDGNRAPGYTLVRDVNGTTIQQTQRWISHDGTLYSVTLSAVESQAEDAEGLLDDLLASWRWLD